MNNNNVVKDKDKKDKKDKLIKQIDDEIIALLNDLKKTNNIMRLNFLKRKILILNEMKKTIKQ